MQEKKLSKTSNKKKQKNTTEHTLSSIKQPRVTSPVTHWGRRGTICIAAIVFLEQDNLAYHIPLQSVIFFIFFSCSYVGCQFRGKKHPIHSWLERREKYLSLEYLLEREHSVLGLDSNTARLSLFASP